MQLEEKCYAGDVNQNMLELLLCGTLQMYKVMVGVIQIQQKNMQCHHHLSRHHHLVTMANIIIIIWNYFESV